MLICFHLKAAYYSNRDGSPSAKLFSNYKPNNARKLFAALSSAVLSVLHLLSNPNKTFYTIQERVRQVHLVVVV